MVDRFDAVALNRTFDQRDVRDRAQNGNDLDLPAGTGAGLQILANL